MKAIDITGKKFNKLTAVRRAGHKVSSGGHSQIQWLFICDCGNERVARSGQVTMEKIKACSRCSRKVKSKVAKENGKLGGKSRIFSLREAALRARVSSFKHQAKYRGHKWELNLEEAIEITQKNCHYCGLVPSMEFDFFKSRSKTHRRNFFKNNESNAVVYVNGIDRIDSSLGYISNNVVPCCPDCNYAKNDKTVEEFMNWLHRISEFQKKNNL